MTKQLPEQYSWLAHESGPKMIIEGLKLFGTLEAPGPANNSTILEWAKEVGVRSVYSGDEIPWCGLFMAVVAKRAGKDVVKDPLWAANWSHFGIPSMEPMLGDVLVFKRPGGHHVALYVGEDETTFHILGGNQSDSVCIIRIFKGRLYAARRPVYSIAQPPNVRKIFLTANGAVSTNEA